MTEEEVVYKVVRRENGRLISSNSPFNKGDQVIHSKWIVDYKPHEWTKPHVKNTKLFCCRRYIDALDFAKTRYNSDYEVWEAKAKGVSSLPPVMKFLYMTWDSYRHNWTNKKLPQQGEKAFYGMVLADEIMLVRRIDEKDG